ncbi:DUF6223 family protein [Micromonospora costi]|uniref:DUF6223 family protein n=1 Tax=Micromonospora costi TaxID=1530042 RepID=UPI0033DD8916
MSVRHLFTAAGAALLGAFGFAAPASAHVAAQPAAASVLTMSAGRIGASAGGVVALVGVVVGGLALARPAGRVGTANGPLGAVVALAAGVIGLVLGAVVAVTADGGVGTGNGLGGAYVALVVGLVSVVLGGLALARARRTA